ncbi:SusC/RagA family TonB-linked outer membrane protein [Pedobacter sp. PAMC26386]|nr:SusC/RagA family TonB-linked outer membrane protein [Pedobacter sp. PAMC26386]
MNRKKHIQRDCYALKFKLLLSVLLGVFSLSGNALAFTITYQQPQQQDTTLRDTIIVDKMSASSGYLNRHVNLWNRTVAKSKNIAGTSTVYREDVGSTPVSNIGNILAGRLAGLYVLTTGGTGPLNSQTGMSLRGQTPLFVIDGVVRSFTNFNPDDIKSVTVMKDALSTNMYGLRSSGGIIYITTRDQAESRPFELNFTAQYGSLEQIKRPNFITGGNYATLYNEAQANTFPGATPTYNAATIAAYQNKTNDPFLQPNNNFYNDVYQKNSAQHRYNISASGNSKSYRYYTSIESFSQGGNLVTSDRNPYNTNNDYKRYNIRTNGQIDFNENIQLSLNVFGSIEDFSEPGVLSNPIIGTGVSTLLNRIYTTSPLAYPTYNADGSFGGSPLNTVTINNVVYGTNILASALNSGYNSYNQRTLNADIGLRFKLDNVTPGLWAKGMVSINNYYLEKVSRAKTFAVYYPNITSTGTTYTKIGMDGTVEAGKGIGTVDNQAKQTFFNALVGYDKSFGSHNLRLLGTYNIDNNIASYTQLNEIFQTAGLSADYAYKNTYLAQLSMSYSGLNRYQPGKRWGFLPSLGLGWIASNASFFKNSGIDFLKIRGSIGQTALADPSRNYFLYLQSFTVNGSGYNFGSTPNGVSGSYENAMVNQNITWEKAWKYDIGFEVVFLGNRLNAEVNYYNNKYYDQLQQRGTMSGIIGQTYPLENLGIIRYSGIEATLGYNGQHKGIGYFIKGNISIAKNKVVDLNEGNYPYPWMYRAGQPGGTVGYEAIGFYQQGEDLTKTANIPGYTPVPGDIKYKDLNGDGIINNLDQKVISGSKALVFFGLNLGFNYKDFDFSALFQGVVNKEVVLPPSLMSAFSNGNGYVLDYTTENRWTPQNPVNATLPRLTLGTNTNNQQPSSFWIQNANYVRLKNIELGYTISGKLLKRTKINKVRVFVNAYNLFTWTPLKYLDPEAGLSGFTNQRVINGGVSLKL